MKKISNEVKIGATALITLLAFIWLYNFLKGKDLFNPAATYYTVYDEIGGLTESNPVEINGYKAGVVQSIDFINDGTGRLLVKLSIDKHFTLPENTVAEITTASLIAGMKIRLVFGKGPGSYATGDTIPGRLAESILTRFEKELQPMKEKLAGTISLLDSVLDGINNVLSPEFVSNVNSSMSNINKATGSINQIVSSKEDGLKAMIADLRKFSGVLAANAGKLDTTIGNLKTISDSIAAADLYTTVLNLKSTLMNTSMLMDGMNKGKGSAGQFFTNDSLYINLNRSVESLDLLLKDLKANPKRYINVSVFGKKN